MRGDIKMKVTKDIFLSKLRNKNLVAKRNVEDLDLMKDNEFYESDNPNSDMKLNFSELDWNGDYFDRLLGSLARESFTEKRCRHAIEVKAFLQEQGIKGFLISETADVPLESSRNLERESANSGKSVNIDEILNSDKDLLSLYKPDPELVDALNKKDINKVKATIKYYIGNEDYSVEDVLLTIRYCEEQEPSLFEEYIVTKARKPIIDDQNQWNEEYLLSQQNYITNNFSIKRLLHIVNVLSFIGKKGADSKLLIKQSEKNLKQEPKQVSRDEDVNNNYEAPSKNVKDRANKENRQSNFIKIAIAVGGVVLLALTALLLSA